MPLSLDITETFNFTETYWIAALERQAKNRLAEEIELSELFDHTEELVGSSPNTFDS